MLSLLALFLYFESSGQWAELNIPNLSYFNNTYFVNDSLGFILEPGGKMHRTADSGMTWDSIGTSYIYSWLNVGHFIDDETGYLGGGANFPFPPSSISDLILKTTDGGMSFDSIYGNFTGSDVVSIDFADENHGIFLTSYASHKTDDGGQTIDSLGLPFTNTISGSKDISYPDVNHAYALAYQNNGPNASDLYIYKSTNQGDDWNLIVIDTVPSQYTRFDFIDANKGFLIADGGRFFKTTDGANTWTKQNIDPNMIFTKIDFVNEQLGFILAAKNDTSYLYSTMDGGTSWQIEQIDTNFSAFSMSLTDSYIYASDNNRLFKRSIDSFTVGINSIIDIHSFDVYPNPSAEYIQLSHSFEQASSYSILDFVGREVLSGEIRASFDSIDISRLSSGAYTLSISSNNLVLGTSRFVVK